jgi:putative transcriptional regulator
MFTKGRLLVAEATMVDPNGALGVVLNRPSDVEVREAVPTWGPFVSDPSTLFVGGPVAPDAAICLSLRIGGEAPGWQPIAGDIGVLDLHRDPTEAPRGVSNLRVFAGYSGWEAGQLESELDMDGWYVVDTGPDDVFAPRPAQLWRDVLARQRGALRQYAFYPDDLRDN